MSRTGPPAWPAALGVLNRPFEAGYEALSRPRYAIGHVLAGQPGMALQTLTALRRLRPEEERGSR